MRYADPSLCPDCRSDLTHGTTRCGTCGLLVRHQVAVDLFRTLQRADTLVTQLRTLSQPAAAPRSAPAAEPVAAGGRAPSGPAVPPPAPRTQGLPAFAGPVSGGTASPPAPANTGVRFTSVPKILLGLGALCLLVAAVIFLAVSWSHLGVGGRTAVLLGLTAGAAGASLWLHRRRLRVAAESLMVVALGLLVLDLLGARSAGWLGDPSPGATALLVGALLAVAGTAAALPRVAAGRLAAPQVVAAVGLLVAYGGALDLTHRELLVGHLVVAAGLAVARLLRGVLAVQAVSFAAVAALAWALTAAAGFATAAHDPELVSVWGGASGWSLLASAAALLAPGVLARHRELTVLGAAGAGLLVTVAVTVPAVDEGTGVLGMTALLTTAAWVVGQWLLPVCLRPVATVPAAAGALLVGGFLAVTAAVATVRVLDAGAPLTESAGVRLPTAELLTEPLLAVPSALVLVAFAAGVSRGRVPWRASVVAAAYLAGAAGVVTAASYDVLLAGVVAATAALALGTTAAGLAGPVRTDMLAFLGLATAFGGVVAALPSAGLTAAAGSVVVLAATAAHLRGRAAELRATAGAALVAGLGLVVWSGGYAAGLEPATLGIPVLLAVGLLALARPHAALGVTATAVGVVASFAAIVDAADGGASLALHLTVAGCLLVADALVHRGHRDLAYAGSALLLLATWVRLGDLGVTAPEPYTLPLATALTAVGLVHLRRFPAAGTAAALLPGLLLGTVPSLLWVLAEPVSLRALVLGAACLGLALAGAALRWSAPLVVGSTVGAAVVLRELGPYAGEAPQWLWIGLAGALLTTVGITWERRLLELRTAVGLLGRLR